MVTVAKREDHGDILWLNWCSNAGRRPAAPVVTNGSMGLAITKAGAAWIRDQMPQTKVSHFDLQLLSVLRKGTGKASFVFPSVGHYGAHGSGILLHDKVRVGEWDAWYVQEGVVPCKPGHQNRQLFKWTGIADGWSPKNVQLLREVVLHDEDLYDALNWKTYFMRDPSTFDEPIAISEKKGRPPAEPLTQEQRREMFDQSRMVKWHGGEKHGHRRQRDWRQQVRLAKFRVFTQCLYEAMSMEYTHEVWPPVMLWISIWAEFACGFRRGLCLKSFEFRNMFRRQKQILGSGLAEEMNLRFRCVRQLPDFQRPYHQLQA